MVLHRGAAGNSAFGILGSEKQFSLRVDDGTCPGASSTQVLQGPGTEGELCTGSTSKMQGVKVSKSLPTASSWGSTEPRAKRVGRARAVLRPAVALVCSSLNLASPPAWSQTLNVRTAGLVCLEISIDAGNPRAASHFGEGGVSKRPAGSSLPSGSDQH